MKQFLSYTHQALLPMCEKIMLSWRKPPLDSGTRYYRISRCERVTHYFAFRSYDPWRQPIRSFPGGGSHELGHE